VIRVKHDVLRTDNACVALEVDQRDQLLVHAAVNGDKCGAELWGCPRY